MTLESQCVNERKPLTFYFLFLHSVKSITLIKFVRFLLSMFQCTYIQFLKLYLIRLNSIEFVTVKLGSVEVEEEDEREESGKRRK